MTYEIKNGLTSAKGAREFEKHQRGEKLSDYERIKAFCYHCLCGFSGGKIDCKTPHCPLYPRMPYNEEVKNKPKKLLSEKQQAALAKLPKFKPGAVKASRK